VMSYNAEGLRDKDYSPKPKKGWTRILLVGSSRMVAPGIAEEDDPPRRLEKYLRGANKKVEVINAGVEGYSPLFQLTRFRHWLEAYSPTHVVLQVEFQPATNSDVMMAPYYDHGTNAFRIRILPWMKPIAYFQGTGDEKDYPKFRYALSWQSSAYRALHTQYCMIFRRSPGTRAPCIAGPTIRALQEMAKIAASAGVKVVVVTSSGSFSNDLVISPAFDSSGVRFWDKLTPRVMASIAPLGQQLRKREIPMAIVNPTQSESLLLPGDYHFNKEGADAYARGLALRLQSFLE
jgi:hypothetical protein